MGWNLEGWEGGKREGILPDFSENWGGWGNKKATASEGACRGFY